MGTLIIEVSSCRVIIKVPYGRLILNVSPGRANLYPPPCRVDVEIVVYPGILDPGKYLAKLPGLIVKLNLIYDIH